MTIESLLAPAFGEASPIAGIAVVLAVLYLLGAIRMRLIGRRWSAWRTLSFLAGCLTVIVVGATGVEVFGQAVFSVFMFQQLTLMVAVPPLLILGSPGTLLLRATPRRNPVGRFVLRLAIMGLRSRIARWLLHPALGIPVFLGIYYGLYLGGLADPILEQPWGHQALELVFFTVGLLLTTPMISSDPLPLNLGHAGRILDLIAEIALHAFFGVIVMMSANILVDVFTEPSLALGIDPKADQGIAGALAWSYGEGPNVLILLFLLHRWYREDTKRATAADRRRDRDGDDELEQYNEYLRKLRGQ